MLIAGPSASDWLDAAAKRVLPKSMDNRVLRYRASQDVPLWEQSDRMYPPFVPNATITNRWYDAASGIEGRQPAERPIAPGAYPQQFNSETRLFAGRDTSARLVGALSFNTAAWPFENPWMVLAAWRRDGTSVRVAQRCEFREGWRVVLERKGERLYLSESDAMPLKLDRVESHYLWGQVTASYMWNTWWNVKGGGLFPLSVARSFDGTLYEQIGVAFQSASLIPVDSAPRLAEVRGPTQSGRAPVSNPTSPSDAAPETIRIAQSTYLLVAPAYNETVSLQRDTVFLLDATTSEARGRGDSTMIAKLFPGKYPMVVVVTDLAWPHISAVRFWVARGATIVSHPASESFLRRVVERRWTLNPDALERSRQTSKFRFRAVGDSLHLAGGALVVYPLQGSTTELALGVWMPAIKYFWAGDYVQATSESPYAEDVVRTIRSLKLDPSTVGGQHVKLTPFADLAARAQARQL